MLYFSPGVAYTLRHSIHVGEDVLSDPDPKLALSVDNLKVDKVSIWNSGTTSTLVSLTPLLSVLITAVALLLSSCFQLWQLHSSDTEKDDTAWRGALEKITLEDKQAVVGALEMQTFFGDKRYGTQARALTATILPKITDHDTFDTALFGMPGGTQTLSTRHFATIARTITNDLHTLHEQAKKSLGTVPASTDLSFEHFVQHPEDFLDDDTHSDMLQRAQTATWKLDSVAGVMSDIWKHGPAGVPGTADLTGIVFSGHDFSGIDFRQANMDGASFIGTCVVDAGRTPPGVPVHCQQKNPGS